jgi:hypothetical protein
MLTVPKEQKMDERKKEKDGEKIFKKNIQEKYYWYCYCLPCYCIGNCCISFLKVCEDDDD